MMWVDRQKGERMLVSLIENDELDEACMFVFGIVAEFLPFFLECPDEGHMSDLRWLSTVADGLRNLERVKLEALAKEDPEAFQRAMSRFGDLIKV